MKCIVCKEGDYCYIGWKLDTEPKVHVYQCSNCQHEAYDLWKTLEKPKKVILKNGVKDD